MCGDEVAARLRPGGDGDLHVENLGQNVCEERDVLVGDAGRVSDPITGGGIINAMTSGRIGGILNWLSGETMLARYTTTRITQEAAANPVTARPISTP